MKFRILFAFFAFVVFALVGCRSKIVAPPYSVTRDFPNQTEETIREGILLGGSARGWAMQDIGKGEIRGVLHVRQHEVVVRISYSARGYSIKYEDSTGMAYNPETQTVHVKYNGWVKNLDRDIVRRITKDTLK